MNYELLYLALISGVALLNFVFGLVSFKRTGVVKRLFADVDVKNEVKNDGASPVVDDVPDGVVLSWDTFKAFLEGLDKDSTDKGGGS